MSPTPLEHRIRALVRLNGPMTVFDYMGLCLGDPEHGYYMAREPFGEAGDFVTAPEVSQMFGEMIGAFVVETWERLGRPAPFNLVEFGPGRGTLMADILRATKGVPGFHAAAQVVLVEASPIQRERQAATLSAYRLTWLQRVEDLPQAPLFLIANELLDALPIRQFQHGPQGWQERLIGLRDETLAFGLSAPLPQVPDTPAFRNAPKGALVEDCLPARQTVAEVATRIAKAGGLAFWIDYGGWRSQGDTLQALRRHAFDDLLAHPGEADLTAHVDFEPLAALAPAFAYDTQGTFLTRLGIDARAERLAQSLTGQRLESHRAAHRRLTHPEEMGSLFKVLAVTSADAPPPPGFA